jgi:hypothetical protein
MREMTADLTWLVGLLPPLHLLVLSSAVDSG